MRCWIRPGASASCTANPIVRAIKAQGANSAFLDNAPAGTYYVILDGRDGAVGSTNVTVALTGP